MAKKPEIKLYCLCGMHATLTFKAGTPLAVQQRVANRVYANGHRGDGHAPCDKRTQEAAMVAELRQSDYPLHPVARQALGLLASYYRTL